MKKFVFAFIATVAMTFAACGGKTPAATSVNDSDSIATDTVVVDSTVVDSTAAAK